MFTAETLSPCLFGQSLGIFPLDRGRNAAPVGERCHHPSGNRPARRTRGRPGGPDRRRAGSRFRPVTTTSTEADPPSPRTPHATKTPSPAASRHGTPAVPRLWPRLSTQRGRLTPGTPTLSPTPWAMSPVLLGTGGRGRRSLSAAEWRRWPDPTSSPSTRGAGSRPSSDSWTACRRKAETPKQHPAPGGPPEKGSPGAEEIVSGCGNRRRHNGQDGGRNGGPDRRTER